MIEEEYAFKIKNAVDNLLENLVFSLIEIGKEAKKNYGINTPQMVFDFVISMQLNMLYKIMHDLEDNHFYRNELIKNLTSFLNSNFYDYSIQNKLH